MQQIKRGNSCLLHLSRSCKMNVKDLFIIEDVLTSNLMQTVHLYIEGTTTFAKAIMPTANGVWDSYLISGMAILVIVEDLEDRDNILEALVKALPQYKLTDYVITFFDESGEPQLLLNIKEDK